MIEKITDQEIKNLIKLNEIDLMNIENIKKQFPIFNNKITTMILYT